MNIVQEEKPNMPTELGRSCLEALDGSTPPLAANIVGVKTPSRAVGCTLTRLKFLRGFRYNGAPVEPFFNQVPAFSERMGTA